jgi:hypothetical protein
VIWPDKTYQTLKNKTNQAHYKSKLVEKCLTTGNYTQRFAYFQKWKQDWELILHEKMIILIS